MHRLILKRDSENNFRRSISIILQHRNMRIPYIRHRSTIGEEGKITDTDIPLSVLASMNIIMHGNLEEIIPNCIKQVIL